MPTATQDVALASIVPSSNQPEDVVWARNLGRVAMSARSHNSSAAQQERTKEFFRVHVHLALVTATTSVHAALLLAPAANVLLAACSGTDAASQKPQDITALWALLLGMVVTAWAIAVCLRWNVIYGVSACCVLLSLPVGQGLLRFLDTNPTSAI